MKPSVAPRTTAATTPGAVGLVTDPAEELVFLSSDHVLTYAGEWVAIAGAQVVAHGPSLEKVRQQALTRLKGRKPTYFAVPAGAATY